MLLERDAAAVLGEPGGEGFERRVQRPSGVQGARATEDQLEIALELEAHLPMSSAADCLLKQSRRASRICDAFGHSRCDKRVIGEPSNVILDVAP
jgi:hypothetical protein